MIKRASQWFRALSTFGKMGLIGIAGVTVLGVSSVNSSPSTQNLNLKKNAAQTQNVTHKTIQSNEEIPFTSTTVNDSTIASGTNTVTTEGANGVRTLTYDVTYTGGIETSRKEIKSEITTEPVNKVTTVGTYVAPQPECPNGTYVNSAGDTVCSPYASISAPAGATAQCADGTYSFSESRSGTCSHHGGVSSWL